MLTIITPLLCF